MRTAQQERARFTYLRTSEVADVLDCSRAHVVDLIQAGRLRAIDIATGSRPEYRVSPEALEEYERAAEVEAA